MSKSIRSAYGILSTGLSILLLGCSSNGRGRYLISTQGQVPGSDKAYLVDMASKSKRLVCGDKADQKCSQATAPYGLSFVVTTDFSTIDIHRADAISTVPHPPCGDCGLNDFSADYDGRMLRASYFSLVEQRSTLWVLRISDYTWQEISDSVRKPSWLTHPVAGPSGEITYFLKATLTKSGVTSVLMQYDARSGSTSNVISDRNVAAFSPGNSEELFVWTREGLERRSSSGKFTRIAPSSILAASERILPGSLAWHPDLELVAIGVCDSLSDETSIVEIEEKTGRTTRVRLGKLGQITSIQAVNR